MASLLVPVLYVVVVFGSLFVFSHYYRKRTASTTVEPYFLSHPDRDIYVSLLQRTDPPASDSLLKSALVRRAMHDVQRVMSIREDKPALQNLLQKGSIGDDLWNSLLAAEKELEAEILEVVGEANSFVEGWGGMIFQTANEMIANEKMRTLFEQTAQAREEKMQKYDIKLKTVTAIPQVPGSHSPTVTSPSSTTSKTPKQANGLAPPSAVSDSLGGSSDGESMPASPATPRMQATPSKAKSSGKKGKKRK